MRVFVACGIALSLFAGPAMAAGGAGKEPTPAASPAAAPASPAEARMENELQQLRDLLESQAKQFQKENEDLKEQLQEQKHTVRELEEHLNATGGTVAAAANAAIGPTVGVANSASSSQPAQDKAAPPTSLQYKGITLTPGGFMAAETVWRQKALGSDVNTPLNAVPFSGASAAHVSEFNASGRQSRIAMLMEGKLDNVKIGGYYEMDFLSAGATSNNNQSNSYTMRQRQFWAQAAFNSGWTVTGGQQWSLLTETTKAMDNRTENLPMTIDAQYHAGFSWARQFGLRFTKNFNNKVWLGFAVEEPQATITVHGNPTAQAAGTAVCLPPACATTTTINTNPTFNNFLLGSFGAGGGLYNALGNYAFNPAPDLVFKAVFEPGFGHYEVFGVLSNFRDRVFPCVPLTGTTPPGTCASITSAAGAINDSRTGGGGGANARWALLDKHVDLGIHFFGGDGIGRYGSVGLADATTRPNGTLALLRNYQALGTLQLHPGKKLDIYFNVGGEFTNRAQYIKSGATPNDGYGAVGFSNAGCLTETLPLTGPSTSSNTGVPTGVGGATGFIPGPLGSCTGDTRRLIEGTVGFWYRFYNGPKGKTQFGVQYSNYVRNTFSGASGIEPHADENMLFTSFRYYLP